MGNPATEKLKTTLAEISQTASSLRRYLLLVPALLGFSLIDAQTTESQNQEVFNCLGVSCAWLYELDQGSERIAQEFNLAEFDQNGDGILETVGSITSGDVIYRPADGRTRVEAGYYIVPNNEVYVDHDGDDLVSQHETALARIVVVIRDSLTYVFREGTSEVQAVFPNGTGSPGANSVARVGVVTAILGPDWGQAESERLFSHLPSYFYSDGTMPNYFGDLTIGVQYYIAQDHLVYTAQEVHGTFRGGPGKIDGEALLGGNISGGCVRHQNHAARYMGAQVRYGDFVITVQTPEDDSADNKLTLYNKTRLAAGLPPAQLAPELLLAADLEVLPRPSNTNLPQEVLHKPEVPTWFNFDQIGYPTTFRPIEHPFTRAHYNLLTCGAESLWIGSQITGQQLLRTEDDKYGLVLPEVIRDYLGEDLRLNDFYTPLWVKYDDIIPFLPRLSGGDPQAAIFQYLFFDFAYQYAGYLVQQAESRELNSTQLSFAISQMSDNLIRRVQQVTGLIPVRYFSSTPGPDGLDGDRLGAARNWTMMRHALNAVYGQPGRTYEIDYRHDLQHNAYEIRDMQLWGPAVGPEVERTGDEPLSIVELLADAIDSGRPAILLVSGFRYLADDSFFNDMAAAHFYTMIPEYTNLEAGYVGIYDTMHPYSILITPVENLPRLFTSLTIAP